MQGARVGALAAGGRLPFGWAPEGLDAPSVISLGSENDPWIQLHLQGAPGKGKYFGIRISPFVAALPSQTVAVSLKYQVLQAGNAPHMALVLREWIEGGAYTFQTQVLCPITAPTTGYNAVAGYLTIRDAGRTVEPMLLINSASDAQAFVDVKMKDVATTII